MNYTQEQIIQATKQIAEAKPTSVVATEFKKTSKFNHILASFKDGGHWMTRNAVESFLSKGELREVIKVVNSVKYTYGENENALESAFNKYRADIVYEIDRYVSNITESYRLSENFEKAFEITGAINARRVSNAPVDNTYAIKQDGYVQLATLIDPSETPTKLGDFRRHGSFDSFKELLFSLPYQKDVAKEYCNTSLSEKARRGHIKPNVVIDNEWYLNDSEFSAILNFVVTQVKMESYSILRTNSSAWFSVVVRSSTEIEQESDYLATKSTVVASNMSYDSATTLASLIRNFTESSSRVKVSKENVERASQRLRKAQREAECAATKVDASQKKLIDALSNNLLESSVVDKVTEIINEFNQDEQATA